jgi:hypothetical protein
VVSRLPQIDQRTPQGLRDYVIYGGRCPSVGVSSFTLGGGLEPFTRSFGLKSDTLVEARIVTPGRIIQATRNKNDIKNQKCLLGALWYWLA